MASLSMVLTIMLKGILRGRGACGAIVVGDSVGVPSAKLV